jgi:hypothetical protein
MQPEQQVEMVETTSWSSPTDHFRTRYKFVTLYTDKMFNVRQWLEFKSWALGSPLVPWFTPLYFGFTHFSQRNRNLFLVENHLNYRPFAGRRNDEDSKYY